MMRVKYLLIIVLFALITIIITACGSSEVQNSSMHNMHNHDLGTSDMHQTHNMKSKDMHQNHSHKNMNAKNNNEENLSYYYTCPMHPEVRQNEPGTCPECGMFLEKKEIKKDGKS